MILFVYRESVSLEHATLINFPRL